MVLRNSCRCLILCLLCVFQLVVQRDKDYVEVFAGMQAVSNGISSMGYVGSVIDKDIGGAAHDLLTWDGYLFAIINVLGIKRGGLLWLAPPCGNFIWMSRHSTQRRLDSPLGQGRTAEIANHLTSRVVFLIWLASCIGVFVIVEQPKSSILWEYPDLERLFSELTIFSAAVEMGAFGSLARKPLILKGAAPWLSQISRKCGRKDRRRIAACSERCALARRFIDKKGISRTRGNHNLTKSAAYPVAFGKHVGVEFAKHFLACRNELSNNTQPVTMEDFKGVPRFELHREGVFDDLWHKIL